MPISKKYGFPLYFYEAKHDSIRERYGTREKYSRLIKKEITFAEEFQTGKDLFTFECTVENPKSPFITLFFLDKPYGIEYSPKVLKLDENNRVTFQTKLQAPSFLFFANKSFRRPIDFSIPFFYAEPRDTLILTFTDGLNEPPLEISGTNATVNQFLRDIPNVRDVFFNLRPRRATEYDVFIRAQKVTEKFNSYLKSSNVNLEGDVIEFIKNELITIEYFHYFAFLNRYYSNSISLSNKSKSVQEINEENEMVRIAEQRIRDFDIHDYFNDYGIFSRKLSIQYFHYYLNNLSRVRNPEFYLVRRNIQEEFEVGKMILGGCIFYRVLADRITNSMTKGIHSLMQPATYELDNAINLINQLINQSYSEYFKQHLQTFRDTRLNWENENYIPETTFYKPDGSAINLDELLKDKPTILYVNNDWGRYRYYWDEQAKKNPGIRFVFVMEGKDLKKWQNYLQQAEPVAEQLILIDNKKSLKDIFFRSNQMYIVYDKNGKLLDFDVDEKAAIQMARESLAQKKEFNKSQLQFIVLLLLIVIILLVTGFIIWKWRVRQRLRKEEQQRRLRELELTAIRSQMNPHFLFNCLNSVQNLVQQNKGREAHLYLADFAGLIRKVLQNSEKEEVSLAEELETVEQYLRLEKLRFNFDFQITVGDGIDPHNTPVPSMLLQPFAENAVIHGLQHKEGERKLKIEVLKESKQTEHTRLAVDNRLAHIASKDGILIIIEDNGIGRAAAQKLATNKNGKGSKLMQERLEILQEKQNEKYRLQITDLNEKGVTGTRVEIQVPEER